MSFISRPLSPITLVSHHLSLIPCILSFVTHPCVKFLVSCPFLLNLLFHFSCILSLVSRPFSLIPCLFSLFPCHLSLLPCLLTFPLFLVPVWRPLSLAPFSCPLSFVLLPHIPLLLSRVFCPLFLFLFFSPRILVHCLSSIASPVVSL